MVIGMSPIDLQTSHEEAWAQIWQHGIEITGNTHLAAMINSSFYYIISSVRRYHEYNSPRAGCMTCVVVIGRTDFLPEVYPRMHIMAIFSGIWIHG